LRARALSPPLHTPSAPLLVEYLSPRVLKKEVIHLLEVRPARFFTTREFRKNSPALFWNLLWHFTNQCFPVDFLLRREKVAEASQAGRRRRKRREVESGSTVPSGASDVSSVSFGSSSSASVPAPVSPLDDYERVIAASRQSGVGRAFGYGSGGMVSGQGAVGISLGALLRTRDSSLPSHSSGPHELDEQEEEDELNEDEFDEDDDHDRRHHRASTATTATGTSTTMPRVITFHETASMTDSEAESTTPGEKE
jgi:hypothetical protein